MVKYPNIEALGLEARHEYTVGYTGSFSVGPHSHIDASSKSYVVSADDLERVLDCHRFIYRPSADGATWRFDIDPTHEGIFFGGQPIVKDTAEDLLREFLDTFGQVEGSPVKPWADRARKLLGEK